MAIFPHGSLETFRGACRGDDTLQREHRGTIGWAVQEMEKGRSVCRAGWNGKGQYLMLQVPDKNSKMTQPYVYITTVQGDLIPWLCSQADLLAKDWEYAGTVLGDARR